MCVSIVIFNVFVCAVSYFTYFLLCSCAVSETGLLAVVSTLIINN